MVPHCKEQAFVGWAAEYVGCAHEKLAKFPLLMPNSLFCCCYWLLFWVSGTPRCWSTWLGLHCQVHLRWCQQHLHWNLNIWRNVMLSNEQLGKLHLLSSQKLLLFCNYVRAEEVYICNVIALSCLPNQRRSSLLFLCRPTSSAPLS